MLLWGFNNAFKKNRVIVSSLPAREDLGKVHRKRGRDYHLSSMDPNDIVTLLRHDDQGRNPDRIAYLLALLVARI